MINTVFENQTLAAGVKSSVSSWVPLSEYYNSHSLTGKFADSGVLRVTYELAAMQNSDFAVTMTPVIQGYTIANGNSPFLVSMGAIRAAAFIRFYIEETGGVNGLTGVYLYFIQAGR